jgi:hypothetical protein
VEADVAATDVFRAMGYDLLMTSGEKLILAQILEKEGFIICESQDDIDLQIITVKLWHKPMSTMDVMLYTMKESGGYENGEQGY